MRSTMIGNHAVSRVVDGNELMVTDQVLKLIPGEKDLQLRFYLTDSGSTEMEDAGMNICIDLQKPEGEYRKDFLTKWPLMKEYANGEDEPTMLDLLPPHSSGRCKVVVCKADGRNHDPGRRGRY